MAPPPSAREIVARFASWDLDDEARAYLRYHRRRYAVLLRAVGDVVTGSAAPRILDVGPSFQTALLRDCHPGGVVDTLGFADARFPARDGERHVEVDLNQAAGAPDPALPSLASYDALVLAEVIEHLRVPASAALGLLAAGLGPRGAIVLQTPNAAALHKRLRLAAGRNPYEPLRASGTNPGHFHEFTLSELREAASAAGLVVAARSAANYFDPGTRWSRLYARAGRALPATLRHGFTLTLRHAGQRLA